MHLGPAAQASQPCFSHLSTGGISGLLEALKRIPGKHLTHSGPSRMSFFFIRNERRGEMLRTVEIHKSGIKYAPQMTPATMCNIRACRQDPEENTQAKHGKNRVQLCVLGCAAQLLAPGSQRVGSELPAHSRPLPTQSLLACEVNATENSHL